MAPVQNAASIYIKGIYCYNMVKTLNHTDVSLNSVQRRRTRYMPGTNKEIHEYVPLYFATHTPMQYVLTQGTKWSYAILSEEDLVFFLVDPVKAFQVDGMRFTDGNASADGTSFYDDIGSLNKLHWDIINTINCYSEDYRWAKAAEVLLPTKVTPAMITKVIVHSMTARDKLIGEIKETEKQTLVPIDEAIFDARPIDIDLGYYY